MKLVAARAQARHQIDSADRVAHSPPSLRVSDMFHYGKQLQKESYKNYPASIPLLIYHGDEDAVRGNGSCPMYLLTVSSPPVLNLPFPTPDNHSSHGTTLRKSLSTESLAPTRLLSAIPEAITSSTTR